MKSRQSRRTIRQSIPFNLCAVAIGRCLQHGLLPYLRNIVASQDAIVLVARAGRLLLVLAVLGFLQIFRFELAMLIVAIGLFQGNGYCVKNVRGLLEDAIHLLQRTEFSLGKEEINRWDHESVTRKVSKSRTSLFLETADSHDSENDVSFVTNVRKRDRSNHDNHKVENPITTDTKLVFICTIGRFASGLPG